MNWKVVAAVGACAGGVVWAVRRRTKHSTGADEWAAATDRVAPATERAASATTASTTAS